MPTELLKSRDSRRGKMHSRRSQFFACFPFQAPHILGLLYGYRCRASLLILRQQMLQYFVVQRIAQHGIFGAHINIGVVVDFDHEYPVVSLFQIHTDGDAGITCARWLSTLDSSRSTADPAVRACSIA